ncbi:hypothetical protein L195_g036123 [Trifolium pratense]|uniref:Uncharacterized protein n=1 Tax=Trifolium pratense TaxID=57577 RepID=A0A2K3LNN2_TRIPR|nr:hypothetical protein L195_g036123 [Trifolium pratense]
MSSKAKMQSKSRSKAPNQPKLRNKQLVVDTMENPQVQEGVYTSELGQILRKHIDEKVKPFRKRCREIVRGKLEFTPVPKSPKGKQESKPKGKQQQKSIEIAKEIISFDFLGDQEALRRFPDIESVLSKLGGWEITGVKRDLVDICDTYYSHETLGTTKLRSVNEVVNHLLPEEYPKLHCEKGKKKENEVQDENKNLESRGKRKRRKRENKEEKKIQIVIPSDDDRLEDMLNNCADNDKSIVAVGNIMEENLDAIVEDFPDYDDLANKFFN